MNKNLGIIIGLGGMMILGMHPPEMTAMRDQEEA